MIDEYISHCISLKSRALELIRTARSNCIGEATHIWKTAQIMHNVEIKNFTGLDSGSLLAPDFATISSISGATDINTYFTIQ